MRVVDLYNQGVAAIRAAGIPDPELETAFLLGHLLRKSRAELILAAKEPVAAEDAAVFEQYLRRRLQRIPLAYVLGEQEFWSLPFAVSPDVLIPRPETELLLEIVLRTVRQQPDQPKLILDLGTGSGVIAAVMALELPGSRVVAIDRSPAALKIAQRNIHKHHLEERVHPVCAVWGQAVKDGRWDLVVSNPPYIAASAMDQLAAEVRNEPDSALNGGEKGMEEIARIASQLHALLKPGGWVFIEIGYDQKEYVLDLFQALAGFSDIAVHDDYAGLPRVLQARKNKPS